MLPDFDHILIPLDFTEKNEVALDVALAVATQNQARVTLLHVIETIEYADGEEIEEFYASLERKAKANLMRMQKRFVDEGLDVDCEITYGRRANEIVRYTAESDIQLVVLSSHKVNLDQPIGRVGTLSHQISILSQCPVLMVK